jgi:hypothetical protein
MTESTGGTWSAKVSPWILFFAVAAAPLPFGSSAPTAIAFWCVVLGIALILAPLRGLGWCQLVLLLLAGVVVAAYAVVLHEQLSPDPWFALAMPHPIWREASDALGFELEPSVAIAQRLPYLELGRPLVAMLSVLCGLVVGTDRTRARELLHVIGWSIAGYAAYGIGSHLIDPTHLLWREKQAYMSAVTSTFVNRNTAAAYFGSGAIVWSLLLWERVQLEMPPGELDWRAMPKRLLANTPRPIAVAFLMLFLCLSAMFMTGSRGGVVLSLMALVIGFTLFFRRDLPRRTGILTALGGGGAVALLVLQLMGAGVNARFDVQGAADGGRLETYRSTLRMIADHPWFGTGQGTFGRAFPAYRSPDVSMWWVWDIAHNTLIEIAADMGVPIAALVILAWAVVFGVLVHGIMVRRRDQVVPAAALTVALLAVLHSLIDFPLQIPGYSIVALALVGAGLAQSFRSDSAWNRVDPGG